MSVAQFTHRTRNIVLVGGKKGGYACPSVSPHIPQLLQLPDPGKHGNRQLALLQSSGEVSAYKCRDGSYSLVWTPSPRNSQAGFQRIESIASTFPKAIAEAFADRERQRIGLARAERPAATI